MRSTSARIITETMTCDECNKQEIEQDAMEGRRPFRGWYHITKNTGTEENPTSKDWDFCSKECVSNFLIK